MPIYEFYCASCDAHLEALKPMGAVVHTCPNCQNEAEKVLSAFSARTNSKSRQATVKDARQQKQARVKLPDDVERPKFDLGAPPPLPDRYVHQLKHHGHC